MVNSIWAGADAYRSVDQNDPRYTTPPVVNPQMYGGQYPFPTYASRGAYSSPLSTAVPSSTGRAPTAQQRYQGGYVRRTPAASPMQMPSYQGAGMTTSFVDPRTGQSVQGAFNQ